MRPHPEPFFLQVDSGPLAQRFALYHAPLCDIRGLVVHVHAFAEEMNKSRRMAALQSRALAANGFAVLQIDLLGCGDSAGDFGDATWTQWVAADEAVAPTMLPMWLWGHRAGALLAVQAAQHLAEPCHLLLWQPSTAGKSVLQQFLRLKTAGDMMSGQARSTMAQLRDTMAAGQPVEVAGYVLHPDLCHGLEQALLHPPAVAAGRVEWFELSTQDDAELSPAAATHTSRWSDAGWAVCTQLVKGPAFWQTTEIEDAPALLHATVAALVSESHTPARDTVRAYAAAATHG